MDMESARRALKETARRQGITEEQNDAGRTHRVRPVFAFGLFAG